MKLFVFLVVAVIDISYANNIPCVRRPPLCQCTIGRPHYWTERNNDCKFACDLDGTLLSCEQNSHFAHRSSCKNRPAPCECRVGKPNWTGEPPNCRYICELEGREMSCEQTEEYITNTCEYVAKPCICNIGEPVWTGEAPDNCQFFCKDNDLLMTCDELKHLHSV